MFPDWTDERIAEMTGLPSTDIQSIRVDLAKKGPQLDAYGEG